MKSTIFRVENEEGTGIYRLILSDSDWNPLDIKQDGFPVYGPNFSRHPGPEEDPILRNFWFSLMDKNKEDDWRFGFESIEKYHEWFYNPIWVNTMINRGDIVLNEYEVKEFRHGDMQSIFEVSSAKLVQTHYLHDLKELKK